MDQRYTTDPAEWWGKGDYELRERAYEPIHERLIERIAPRPGERLLDVGCGLGEVAVRAARAGAEVTAIDLSPEMIERAGRRPEPVDWQVGDCQALPFEDDSFDVVVSSFGVIFAPDPGRAAAELSRVCRGRLALTAWMASPGRELWPSGEGSYTGSRLWSSDSDVAGLLPEFHLDSEEGVWWLEGESGQEMWSWVLRSSPPTRARLNRLSTSEAHATQRAWIDRYESFRVRDSILVPHMYLLSSGRKR